MQPPRRPEANEKITRPRTILPGNYHQVEAPDEERIKYLEPITAMQVA